jgi:hypothetical protein
MKFAHALALAIILAILSLALPLIAPRFTPTGRTFLHETFDTPLSAAWTSDTPTLDPQTNNAIQLTSPPRTALSRTIPAPPAGTYLRWSAKASGHDITVGPRAWMHGRIDLVPILHGYTQPDWHLGRNLIDAKANHPTSWRHDLLLVPPKTQLLYLRIMNAGDAGTLIVHELRLEEVRPSRRFLLLRIPIYLGWILLGMGLLKRFFPGRSLKGWLAIGAIASFFTLCLIPSALITNSVIRPLTNATYSLIHRQADTAAPTAPATRPKVLPTDPVTFPWDKVGHAAFIFTLALLLAIWFADPAFPHPRTTRTQLRWLLIITLGISFSSELLQSLSLMRSLSWQDLIADAIGIAAALPLAILLARKASHNSVASGTLNG